MMTSHRIVHPVQPQFKLLDLLNFFIIFLQLRTEMKVNKQASNDELLKEIQKDTDAIIEHLNRIEKEKQHE